jgi:hypothetical protein
VYISYSVGLRFSGVNHTNVRKPSSGAALPAVEGA